MSKYVNVDAFVEALCKTLSTLRKQKDNTPESIAFLKGAQVVAKELMKFPAADVVVRCKNCVHYHPCQVELADGSAPDWGICDQPCAAAVIEDYLRMPASGWRDANKELPKERVR